ncbi:hypothetical protein [Paraburkholderia youngii]|uniref:hypothetical protein n=1 Tax=Paraburkholderia youngii TaxID=2782701 RepID=UPI003D23DB33
MKNSDAENLESGSPRLSAHEMAALMLLGHAPVKVDVEVEDLDMTALHDAGLAQRIEREPGWQERLPRSDRRAMAFRSDCAGNWSPDCVIQRAPSEGRDDYARHGRGPARARQRRRHQGMRGKPL